MFSQFVLYLINAKPSQNYELLTKNHGNFASFGRVKAIERFGLDLQYNKKKWDPGCTEAF